MARPGPRLPGWRGRLNALLDERRRQPASAMNNCGFFTADAVLALTGIDLAAVFRGETFKSVEAAQKALSAAGYGNVVAFAAAHLDECHPARARAGDLMAFTAETGDWALGVVSGERVTVLTPRGLGTVALTEGERCFRVG